MNDRQITTFLMRAGAAGGVLFAAGNLLHPLEHTDQAEASPTWEAAHLLFGLGAVLLCAALPRLAGPLGTGKLARVSTAMVWAAMLLVPVGAYFEVYVAPTLSEAAVKDIESSAIAFWSVSSLLFILGSVLFGVAAFRVRAWTLPVRAALVAGPLLLMAAPGLPGVDGIWIIAGTTILGLGLAATALPPAESSEHGAGVEDAVRV
jgi:hypothetical protein